MARYFSILLFFFLSLTGCATQPPAPVVTRGMGEDVEGKSSAATSLGLISVPVFTRDTKRPPGPMPDRALNVSTQCDFKDELGTHGHLAIQIKEANIQRFTAKVTIPTQGVCHFDITKFRQTEKMPIPVLVAKNSSCRITVWEQDNAVTVSFNACSAHCTNDAFSYLWPILIDRPSGECA